jgi:hypothetical protein
MAVLRIFHVTIYLRERALGGGTHRRGGSKRVSASADAESGKIFVRDGDVLAEVLIEIVELQEIAYSPLLPPGCVIATVFVDPYGKSIQEKQDGGK